MESSWWLRVWGAYEQRPRNTVLSLPSRFPNNRRQWWHLPGKAQPQVCDRPSVDNVRRRRGLYVRRRAGVLHGRMGGWEGGSNASGKEPQAGRTRAPARPGRRAPRRARGHQEHRVSTKWADRWLSSLTLKRSTSARTGDDGEGEGCLRLEAGAPAHGRGRARLHRAHLDDRRRPGEEGAADDDLDAGEAPPRLIDLPRVGGAARYAARNVVALLPRERDAEAPQGRGRVLHRRGSCRACSPNCATRAATGCSAALGLGSMRLGKHLGAQVGRRAHGRARRS